MASNLVTYENIDPRARNTIMLGLVLAMMAACLDGTIVGTIGTIVATDLGGLDLYAWMTTAYLLCETIMIPVAGKLSDIYGRKPLFLLGLGLFAAGSVIAGLSTSMEMFIICRAVQGLGGGILIPVATAAVADLYAPRERARMQGLLGAVFGIGSGIGPLLGGAIEGALSWHWCFYINIPFAIAAFALTIFKFPAPVDDSEKHIDVKGIALLALLLLDVLLFIEFGGSEFEWVSAVSAVMIVLAVVLLVLFWRVERTAVEPVLAPHLFRNRTVVMAMIFMAIFGIGMMGAMMYSNMFAIMVFGLSTMDAGIWSLAMVAGMMITSMASGVLLNRTGYKPWLIAGPILCFIGMFILSGMSVTTDMVLGYGETVMDAFMYQYLTGIFLFGLGLGCMMAVIMTAVQNSSRPSEMGMTTSSVNLMRSIGCTMGTAIFSMIITAVLDGELMNIVPEVYETFVEGMGVTGTGVLNYLAEIIAMDPTLGLYSGTIVSFANSVDTSFLIGGILLLCLVIVGAFFKETKPEEDKDFEEAKQRIMNNEE